MVREITIDGHKSLSMMHAKRTVSDGEQVQVGDSIGAIMGRPKQLSERYHSTILRSKQLYKKHKFAQAARIMHKAYKKEPNNPFVANTYARALYRTKSKRRESFPVYRNLISHLDSTFKARFGGDATYIDMWFLEAYWKLGTLYMDRAAYRQAIFEISRALMSRYGIGPKRFYVQAFLYLSEAFHRIGEKEKSKCMGEKVLGLDPNNRRVLKYVDQDAD